jgi:hypothetical protein
MFRGKTLIKDDTADHFDEVKLAMKIVFYMKGSSVG